MFDCSVYGLPRPCRSSSSLPTLRPSSPRASCSRYSLRSLFIYPFRYSLLPPCCPHRTPGMVRRRVGGTCTLLTPIRYATACRLLHYPCDSHPPSARPARRIHRRVHPRLLRHPHPVGPSHVISRMEEPRPPRYRRDVFRFGRGMGDAFCQHDQYPPHG